MTRRRTPLPHSNVQMTRTRRLRAGKKTREWNRERAKIKKVLLMAGIIYCELQFEGCWRDNALGLAHPRKRRHLKEGELSVAILACAPCHSVIERMPESEMCEIVYRVIAERKAA